MLHERGASPRRLTFEAVETVLDSGSHHPWRCSMNEGGRPAGSWVVKHVHSEEEDPEVQLLAEVAAADVASWLGLATPETGITEVPRNQSDLVAGLGERARSTYDVNQGVDAYCSRFLDGAHDVPTTPFAALPRTSQAVLTEAALRLLFFDWFLNHTDRTRDRPNALFWEGQVVVIDHGQTFGALRASGSEAADRTVWKGLKDHVARHVDWTKVAPADLDVLVESVKSVPDHEIRQLEEKWPKKLADAKLRRGQRAGDAIVEFLLKRRHKAAEIAESLRKEVWR